MEGVGDFLYAHVGVAQEVLGLEEYVVRNPFGRPVARGAADDTAEVLGCEVHLLGIEGNAPFRAEVLAHQLGEAPEEFFLVVVYGMAVAFVLLLEVAYEMGNNRVSQCSYGVAHGLVVVGEGGGLADALGHCARLSPEEGEGVGGELQGTGLAERADVRQQILQGEVYFAHKLFAEQDDGGVAVVNLRHLHDGSGLGKEDAAGPDGHLLQVAGDGEFPLPAEQDGEAVEPRRVAEHGLALFYLVPLWVNHYEALVVVELSASGVEFPFAQQLQERKGGDVIGILHRLFSFRTQI